MPDGYEQSGQLRKPHAFARDSTKVCTARQGEQSDLTALNNPISISHASLFDRDYVSDAGCQIFIGKVSVSRSQLIPPQAIHIPHRYHRSYPESAQFEILDMDRQWFTIEQIRSTTSDDPPQKTVI